MRFIHVARGLDTENIQFDDIYLLQNIFCYLLNSYIINLLY